MVNKTQQGFTLIEVMIVVAIIAILVAIALPSYQSYVKKTKRGDMMVQLQNIASQIQSQKLAKGSFANVDTTSLIGDYPKGNALYTVSISPDPLTSEWELTATPKAGKQMAGDGNLTLNATGKKCHQTQCGQGEEWRR